MAGVGNFVLDKGADAAAAITKFRAVKAVPGQPDQVTPVTAATDVVVGIEQFGVSAPEILKGKGSSHRVQGISEMEASAAIGIGDKIAITADGRAKTSANGERVIGMCMYKGAANAGERCSVVLALPGYIQLAGM